MKKKLQQTNKTKFIAIALLVTGIFFRFYKPELYIFGFDQVQILTNAQEIAKGNLTLIGPRTGPAEMFTGPLVYYITAILLFFVSSPWAIVGMSSVIAGVTGLTIYLLARKYVSTTSAITMLFIWAMSPLFIHFDRIAWNPNLTMLASSLVFFPVVGILNKKKASRFDLILIFLGSFLGFQAHFSGLLLPPLLLLTLIFMRRFSFSTILASGLGLLTSILPTLIFDARNGWLNTRGLLSFVTEKESVGGTLFFDRLSHSIKVTLETTGSLIPFAIEKQTSIYIAVLFLALLFWKLYKKHDDVNIKNVQLALFWIVTIILIFSFYRSNSPEYYFFIYLPAVLLLLSTLFESFAKKIILKFELLALIILVLFFYLLSNFSTIGKGGVLRIGNQLALAQDIASYSKLRSPISQVVYDLQYVDTIGMRYFIENSANLSKIGNAIHIASTSQTNSRYDQFGLWVDPRTNLESNYLTRENLVIETPKTIQLFEDMYLGESFGPHPAFQVAQNDLLTGDILVVVQKIDNPFLPGNETFSELVSLAKNANLESGWKTISHGNYQGYVKNNDSHLLIYIPNEKADTFILLQTSITTHDITPKVLQ